MHQLSCFLRQVTQQLSRCWTKVTFSCLLFLPPLGASSHRAVNQRVLPSRQCHQHPAVASQAQSRVVVEFLTLDPHPATAPMTGTSISRRRRTAVRIRSGTRMAASAARRCASSAARRLLQRSAKYCALAAPQCDVSVCFLRPRPSSRAAASSAAARCIALHRTASDLHRAASEHISAYDFCLIKLRHIPQNPLLPPRQALNAALTVLSN